MEILLNFLRTLPMEFSIYIRKKLFTGKLWLFSSVIVITYFNFKQRHETRKYSC